MAEAKVLLGIFIVVRITYGSCLDGSNESSNHNIGRNQHQPALKNLPRFYMYLLRTTFNEHISADAIRFIMDLLF